MNARDRIRRAVVSMLRQDPFFASLIMRQKIVADPTHSSFAVNGDTLRYNPEWIEAQSDDRLRVALKQKAMRVALRHHLRMGGYEELEFAEDEPLPTKRVYELLNDAGDLAVNSMLKNDPGFPKGEVPVPGEGKWVALKEGMNFEAYYPVLRSAEPPPQKQKPEEGQGNEGQEGQEGQAQNDGQGAPGSGKAGKAPPEEGQTPPAPLDGPDSPAQAPSPMGEVEPNPAAASGDPDEKAKAEREWEMAVTQAAMAAKSQGNLPGWMQELIEKELTPPKLPWPVILRQFCTRAAKTSHTYCRPSRRGAWREDILTPGKTGRTLQHVVWIADVSGSMSADVLNKGLKEMQAIMTSWGKAKLTLLQCDTRVTDRKVFTPGDPMQVDRLVKSGDLKWTGRGGTCMDPAFEETAKMRADCIVCFTDGYMRWPEHKKVLTPVLWVMTTDLNPPWGMIARMGG